jgi:hypothetical protein
VLLEHEVYGCIADLTALRRFMEYHVFAVWDFMSLLKTLQRRICCIDVPWLPPDNVDSARLINEIVLAEETDEIAPGEYSSHFGMYLSAMREAGAETAPIEQFLAALRRGSSVTQALDAPAIPPAVRNFVSGTFQVIDSGNLPAIASAFTFGREDLLPGLFQQIVEQVNADTSGRLSTFVRYLERHIELDGDEHGPLARRLVESLCGQDARRWESVERAAREALHSRLQLWDAIHSSIRGLAPVTIH